VSPGAAMTRATGFAEWASALRREIVMEIARLAASGVPAASVAGARVGLGWDRCGALCSGRPAVGGGEQPGCDGEDRVMRMPSSVGHKRRAAAGRGGGREGLASRRLLSVAGLVGWWRGLSSRARWLAGDGPAGGG
jgi:hypothetical protein